MWVVTRCKSIRYIFVFRVNNACKLTFSVNTFRHIFFQLSGLVDKSIFWGTFKEKWHWVSFRNFWSPHLLVTLTETSYSSKLFISLFVDRFNVEPIFIRSFLSNITLFLLLGEHLNNCSDKKKSGAVLNVNIKWTKFIRIIRTRIAKIYILDRSHT